MSTIITSSTYFNSNGKSCQKTPLPHSRSYNVSTIQRQHHLFFKISLKSGIFRDRAALSNCQPKASSSSSSDPSSSSWKKWVWCILLSVILPAAGHKGGLILGLKGKIDQAVQTVEHVTEMVEEIAEEAEKIAEEVEKKLPGDSKLKEALDSFEDLTKMAVKEAEKTEDIIHKMKAVEEEIDAAILKSSKAGGEK